MYWESNGLSSAAQTALRVALNLTFASKAEPEHLLLALLADDDSPLVKVGRRLRPNLDVPALRDALVIALQSSIPATPPAGWSDALLGPRLQQLLASVTAEASWSEANDAYRDQLLAAAAVAACKPRIRNVLGNSGVDPDAAAELLRRPPVARDAAQAAFDAAGNVNLAAFDRPAQAVLRLFETEGRGLGMKRLTAPLWLYALLSRKNGLLETALRMQAPKVDPRKVHGNLLLHLKALGQSRFNEDLQLARSQMQDSVAAALEHAEREAADVEAPLIGELELVKGLLRLADPFIETFLRNEQVDIGEVSRFIAQRKSAVEEEAPPENALPSIDEVERRLRERIVGQSHVIDAVLPIIKRLRFGYTRQGRPAGVLLFLGMSGTGKTQLAKELARAVYGSEDQLIFLEMGQFGTEHSKTMFVGAPPGLVGYGEGLLTNGLRDKPEAVVLFDEVEKAHKSVFDVVLRFLDEGRISDPAGAVRDGTRCILILTSNHALDVLQPVIERQTASGVLSPQERSEIRTQVRRAILKTEFFRPEFINRVDDVLLFNTFTEDSYRRILRNQLADECRRFAERERQVTIDDSVLELLTQMCVARRDEGARVCGKLVSDLIVTPLIDYFVDDRHAGVTAVQMRTDSSGALTIQPAAAAAR